MLLLLLTYVSEEVGGPKVGTLAKTIGLFKQKFQLLPKVGTLVVVVVVVVVTHA